MSQDLRDLLERMSAIESGITPVAVKSGLNPQQKSADQLPALFRPHQIKALGAKTDPQHPMKGMAVGASESSELGQAMIGKIATNAGLPPAAARTVATSWPNKHPQDVVQTTPTSLEETIAEIEEDMLGKIKQDLSAYLDQLADKTSDDGQRDRGTPELDKLSKKERRDRDLVARAKQQVARGQVEENAEELNIGDEVIITGPVQYQGATGVIDDFGRDKRFVVVNIQDQGRHSFHSSDVSLNDDISEDPTQQELTVEPPTPPTTDPTLPESSLVRTLALEDGTIMEIHNDDQGYEIRRGSRRMRTRFPDLDQANLALDLFRARRREQDDDQDYVEER